MNAVHISCCEKAIVLVFGNNQFQIRSFNKTSASFSFEGAVDLITRFVMVSTYTSLFMHSDIYKIGKGDSFLRSKHLFSWWYVCGRQLYEIQRGRCPLTSRCSQSSRNLNDPAGQGSMGSLQPRECIGI